jgi:hypothetical protein
VSFVRDTLYQLPSEGCQSIQSDLLILALTLQVNITRPDLSTMLQVHFGGHYTSEYWPPKWTWGIVDRSGRVMLTCKVNAKISRSDCMSRYPCGLLVNVLASQPWGHEFVSVHSIIFFRKSRKIVLLFFIFSPWKLRNLKITSTKVLDIMSIYCLHEKNAGKYYSLWCFLNFPIFRPWK